MNKKPKSAKPPSEEYQRFEKLAKSLIAVPKSEIDNERVSLTKSENSAFGQPLAFLSKQKASLKRDSLSDSI